MEVMVCIADHEMVKSGSYIVACPDGWQWSPLELAHPAWKIVKVPITVIECEALCDRTRFSIDVAGLAANMTAQAFRALVRDSGFKPK